MNWILVIIILVANSYLSSLIIEEMMKTWSDPIHTSEQVE